MVTQVWDLASLLTLLSFLVGITATILKSVMKLDTTITRLNDQINTLGARLDAQMTDITDQRSRLTLVESKVSKHGLRLSHVEQSVKDIGGKMDELHPPQN